MTPILFYFSALRSAWVHLLWAASCALVPLTGCSHKEAWVDKPDLWDWRKDYTTCICRRCGCTWRVFCGGGMYEPVDYTWQKEEGTTA